MASFEAQLIQQGIKQGREEGVALGREEGVALGREEGVEFGHHQGVRDVLVNQLRLRFGSLDSATQARVMSGDADELNRWVERVLTAGSLDAVFDD